jgi:type VI secretion system protein ImpJ
MGVFSQCRCISAGIPIPWGVEKIEFNDSLLSSGLIQITQLRLWLEDGTLIDAQRSDLPPAPRELDASQLAGRDAVTVVIALPHMQPGVPTLNRKASVQTGRFAIVKSG